MIFICTLADKSFEIIPKACAIRYATARYEGCFPSLRSSEGGHTHDQHTPSRHDEVRAAKYVQLSPFSTSLERSSEGGHSHTRKRCSLTRRDFWHS